MKTRFSLRRMPLALLLALCSVLVLLIWFFLAVSGNIRMDSDRMIYDRNSALSQYRDEGRFGLAFILQYLFPSAWNPDLYGVLFLLFFVSCAWILTLFLARFSEYSWPSPVYGLFFLLFGTSPVWAFQVYFTLQSPVVALGMLVAVLSAGLDVRFRTEEPKPPFLRFAWELAACLLCVFIMSVYQSLIVCYLSAAAVLLCCRLLHGGTFSWKSALLWALRILFSVVLYIVLARLIRTGNNDYLMYQIQWLRLPFFDCLKDVAVEFGKILLPPHSGTFSVYLPGLVLFFVMLVGIFRKRRYDRYKSLLLLLCGFAFILLPMAMSLLEGGRTVPRTQFALPLVAAFLPVCFIGETGKARKVLSFICVLAVLVQSFLVIRLANTDNCRNDRDVDAAARIQEVIKKEDAAGKPLVILGSLPFEDDSVFLEKTDVFGLSFSEWTYNPSWRTSASTGMMRLLKAVCDDPDISYTMNPPAEVYTAAEKMPSYPDDGFILLADNYCIIKLSE